MSFSRLDKLDFSGVFVLGLWVVWSVAVGNAGHSIYFQRLGAFGVAAAVGYFAVLRILLPKRIPVATLQRLHELTEADALLKKMIVMNGTNLVAQQRWLKIHSATLQSITAVLEGKPVVSDEAGILVSDSRVAEYGRIAQGIEHAEENLVAQSKNSTNAKLEQAKLVELRHRSFEITQALALILATLQWGFGDLLIDWLAP